MADFKFVLIVSHMSRFQLSDEFLFAQLHLSSSISPPLRLSLTFPSASPSLWRKARLVELIIYSCLSPNSALYRREKRERRGQGLFSFHVAAEDRSEWMTAPARGGLGSQNTLRRYVHVPELNAASPSLSSSVYCVIRRFTHTLT